ncbi:MAG: hypothetical protein NVS9B10_27860 [Nevskia sp.]
MAAVIDGPAAAPQAAAPARSGGLVASDFRLICDSGFGDGWNAYAHSMAWFEGCLYIGTTRATMAAMKLLTPPPDIRPWPIEAPADVYDIDRRAEIWRYTPGTATWVRVYQAAWVPGRTMKRKVPRYVGFRGMTVFRSPSDSKPCLYVSTWAPAQAEPPDILRCEDGENFANVARPPWDKSVRSFRTLQVFKGRVHTSPTGSNVQGLAQECVGSEATIYCSEDLQSGVWGPASPESFGEKSNLTVFEMGTFDDHLYAATVNPSRGFELWKTRGEGGPPYRWTRVLERGAWRGPFNEVGVSLCEFKGALYVGTGIVNGGYHRAFRLGPAAAEIIRVWPDDRWDLLVGQSRVTPQGLKYPLSGYSAGFDNLFNGYVWRMVEHDGHLYAGTFSWANMLPYLPSSKWPEDVLRLMKQWGMEQLTRRYGGFALWRTQDGIRWHAVTRSGFENKYNWGLRNFASTEHGLFVASANPFGPRVAIRQDGVWQYVDNNRGGCEVFLGARAGSAPRQPGTGAS